MCCRLPGPCLGRDLRRRRALRGRGRSWAGRGGADVGPARADAGGGRGGAGAAAGLPGRRRRGGEGGALLGLSGPLGGRSRAGSGRRLGPCRPRPEAAASEAGSAPLAAAGPVGVAGSQRSSSAACVARRCYREPGAREREPRRRTAATRWRRSRDGTAASRPGVGTRLKRLPERGKPPRRAPPSGDERTCAASRGSGCKGPAKPRRRRQAAAGAGCTGHRSDPSIAQNTKFMQTQSPPSESSRIGKLNSIVSFYFFSFKDYFYSLTVSCLYTMNCDHNTPFFHQSQTQAHVM